VTHRENNSLLKEYGVLLKGFLADAKSWARECSGIVALALVGSYARNEARPDSDIDLVVLCTNPAGFHQDTAWISRFGKVQQMGAEDYGKTQSLRVFYVNGLEVEFGIADPTWVSIPLDEGTKRVLTDGVQILHDPQGLLARAVHEIVIA